jgi:hypothetical protein
MAQMLGSARRKAAAKAQLAQVDGETRLDQPRQILEATRSPVHPRVPAHLQDDKWRLRILDELDGLRGRILNDYRRSLERQRRQAWEYRWGGPLATGLGAGIGSVMAAVGAGIASSNKGLGWTLIVAGFLVSVVGSVLTSNNYVYNRKQTLRFLRLLYDISDYCALVLPTAEAPEVFTQVDTFRQLWETAGT